MTIETRHLPLVVAVSLLFLAAMPELLSQPPTQADEVVDVGDVTPPENLQAAKDPSDYSRLVEDASDLAGLWRTVKWIPFFHIPNKDWNNPAFMRHQWYLFAPDGWIRVFSSNKDYPVEDVREKLDSTETHLRCSIAKKGFMRIASTENPEIDELWRCAWITSGFIDNALGISLEEGDILLTQLASDGRILFVRQLRRDRGN